MLSNTDKKKLLSDFDPGQTENPSGLDQKNEEIPTLLKQNSHKNLD